jgi:LacI family transcriptional regulator
MLTAKDIAELSGVSRTTVFAVLAGKPGVSAKTREKVVSTLRQHGYESGLVPRALVAELSTMIGVLVGSINNPWYTEVMSGIESVFRPGGFHHVLYHGTDVSYENGIAAFESMFALQLRGYVICGGMAATESGGHMRPFEGIVESRKPVVTIMPVPGLDTHLVSFDPRKAFEDATDYLIAKGHKRITCLSGPADRATAQQRFLGFVESLVRHGIEFADHMAVRAGETSHEGYLAARKALAEPEKRPTALACYNDLTAIGAYKAAHELGLRIPDDLSVMGFDGIELGEVMGPPLTSVSIFPRTIGETAAILLLEVIDGRHRRGYVKRVIEHALIERESVRQL